MDPSPDDRAIDAEWRALRAHVRARIPTDEQAEDVVQEAWLRRLLRPPNSAEFAQGWLRVVAERLVFERKRLRRNRRRREEAAARPELVPEPQFDVPQQESRVLALVRELRDPYGLVVRLRYLEDCEIEEIARRTGRSEATVRSQLKRGLDQLRARFGVEAGQGEGTPRRTGAWALWLALRRRASRALPSRRAPHVAIRMLGAAALTGLLLVSVLRALGATSSSSSPAPTEVASSDGARYGDASAVLDSPPRGANERQGIVPTVSELVAPSEELVIRGVVRSQPAGTPLAGARILAYEEPDAEPEVIALADGEGRFAARRSRFPVWVGADHEEHSGTRRLRVDRGFALSGAGLELYSRRAGRMRALVVDRDGRPVAHAAVRVGRIVAKERRLRGAAGLLEMPAGTYRTSTDEEGRFSCPVRDSARARVEVDDGTHGAGVFLVENAYEEQRFVLDGSGAPAVPSPAPEASSGLGSIRGRLVRDGATAAGAAIDLRIVGDALGEPRLADVGDDLGFEIDSLPAGRLRLLVEGGGALGAWTAREFDLARDENLDLGSIALPAPGALSVRTTRAEHDPAPERLLLARAGVELHIDLLRGAAGLEVDPDGERFELARVWPGEYAVGLQGARLALSVRSAQVDPGRTSEVRLERRAGGSLVLRVEFPRDLEADETVEIRVVSATGVAARTWRDVAGSLEFGRRRTFGFGVPEDAHRVEVESSGGLVGEADLPPRDEGGKRSLELTLREPTGSRR